MAREKFVKTFSHHLFMSYIVFKFKMISVLSIILQNLTKFVNRLFQNRPFDIQKH